MNKLVFLVLLLLSLAEANASQEVHYQVINPVSKTVISQDSLRLADSLRLSSSRRENLRTLKSISGIVGVLFGISTVRNAIDADGFAMLGAGFASIFFLILAFRKNKKMSYDELKWKEKQKQKSKEKRTEEKNSWSWFIANALVGINTFLLSFFAGVFYISSLGFIPYLVSLLSMAFFGAGFREKFVDKKKRERRKLWAFFWQAINVLYIILLSWLFMLRLR